MPRAAFALTWPLLAAATALALSGASVALVVAICAVAIVGEMVFLTLGTQ